VHPTVARQSPAKAIPARVPLMCFRIVFTFDYQKD
jgi:hypothetical protein